RRLLQSPGAAASVPCPPSNGLFLGESPNWLVSLPEDFACRLPETEAASASESYGSLTSLVKDPANNIAFVKLFFSLGIIGSECMQGLLISLSRQRAMVPLLSSSLCPATPPVGFNYMLVRVVSPESWYSCLP
ncbi:unnamed protein product, partial [Phaeothamnion confervicola]